MAQEFDPDGFHCRYCFHEPHPDGTCSADIVISMGAGGDDDYDYDNCDCAEYVAESNREL